MGTLLFTGFCFTVKPSQGDHHPQNRSHIIGLWLKYWVSWVGWGRNIFLSFIYSIGSIWYLTLDQSIPNIWTRIVFSFNISWQRSCNVFCYWLQAFTPGKDLTNVDKYRKRKKDFEAPRKMDETSDLFLHGLVDDVWFLETSAPAPTASCGLEAFSHCHRTMISNDRISTQN